MAKLTLQDKIVLHLADSADWVKGYNLEKVNTKYGWIGSSGQRRCRELVEVGLHTIDGVGYVVESGKEGKYVTYRAYSASPHVVRVEQVIVDGVRKARPIYG